MSHAFMDIAGDYILELDNEILIKANVVAELERERIIKLLEDSHTRQTWFDNWDHKGRVYTSITKHFIALIRGEQIRKEEEN